MCVISLKHILSSGETGTLRCVPFGFLKGTLRVQCFPRELYTKEIRRPEFFASISTPYLAFVGLLSLILKLGSFRKSVVRSVLAVKIPVCVSQCFLQSNTFLVLIFLPPLNSCPFSYIPCVRAEVIHLKGFFPPFTCQTVVSLFGCCVQAFAGWSERGPLLVSLCFRLSCVWIWHPPYSVQTCRLSCTHTKIVPFYHTQKAPAFCFVPILEIRPSKSQRAIIDIQEMVSCLESKHPSASLPKYCRVGLYGREL